MYIIYASSSYCELHPPQLWKTHNIKTFFSFSMRYNKLPGCIKSTSPYNKIIYFGQVKWIRVLYSDFSIFTKDQEQLISSENSFDYIEGFIIINRTGLLNNWRSSFRAKDPVQANQFSSDGRTLYCLEVVKHFNPDDTKTVNQVRDFLTFNKYVHNVHLTKNKLLKLCTQMQSMESLLSKLSYIPSTLFLSEVPYVEFLDRVHVSEKKLQAKGLWEIPHPWLNFFVPKSRISDFAEEIFGNILTDTSNGPVLIYPVNQSK